MSDFGSEVGNAGLSMMGKVMEALMKLLDKIFETVKERTSAEYRLKKAELKDVKEKTAFKKFAAEVEGRAGLVNYDDLKKAKVPLTAVGITLEREEMQELAARCKREGIIITGVEDIRQREMAGAQFFAIECRTSDLERLGSLLHLMNDEKRIIAFREEEIAPLESRNKALRAEIAELRAKPHLTQEDLDKIKELETEIEVNDGVIKNLNKKIQEFREDRSRELNNEQAIGVVEKVVNGETERGVTFDDAINRWTGGRIDKDATCYVVDAKDPDRYIICTSKNDIFHNKDYVKTTYEVYNGDNRVYTTHDGRFDGRPDGYWKNEKAAMRDKGGISDQVIKFNSKEEMEAYRENYKAQNAAELGGLDVGKEGRDYGEIINTLEGQLDKCGATYKDGVAVDQETGDPLVLTEGMSEAERARVAEAVIIGRQIKNYHELAELGTAVNVARVDVMTNTEGSPEYIAAQAELNAVQDKCKAALELEASQIDDRKSINAVQAELETREDREREADREPQEKTKADEREAALDARNAEKFDGSRDERVDKTADKHQTMEQFKADIKKMKAQDAAKARGEAHRPEHGIKVPGAKPKDRGDR